MSVFHFRTVSFRSLLPIFLLIVSGVCLVGIGSEYLQSARAATVFFTEQLATADAYEEVYIGPNKYTVVRGKIFRDDAELGMSYTVLRLAHAKLLARKAPILGAPGVDPDELTEATRRLDEMARTLSDVQSTVTEREVVRHDLSPTDFVRSLAALERSRQTFLDSGTWELLRLYDRALIRALSAYSSDLDAFRSGFEKAVPPNVGPFAIERIIMTRESVLAALDRLEAGKERLARAAYARTRCEHGILAVCEPLPEPSLGASASEEPDVVLAEALQTKLTDSGWKGFERPFIELAASSCVSRNPLFLDRYRATPFYAGDLRLLPIEKFKDEPYVDYFAEHNIPYLYSTPFTYYGCLDAMNDYGIIRAVLSVRTFAMRTPISGFTRGAERSALRGLEQKLASERVVKESDAREYVARAERLSLNFTPELKHEIDTLSLSLRARTGGLPELIDTIVTFELSGLALDERGITTDKSAKYLFYVRSAIFSLLLAHTMDPDIERAFVANNGSERTWPYVWYSELPHDELFEESIARSLSFYHRSQDGL